MKCVGDAASYCNLLPAFNADDEFDDDDDDEDDDDVHDDVHDDDDDDDNDDDVQDDDDDVLDDDDGNVGDAACCNLLPAYITDEPKHDTYCPLLRAYKTSGPEFLAVSKQPKFF